MILDPVSGFAFAAGIIVALISTQPVRLAAFRWGILDRPSTSIKTHEGAVPTLGGVPIFLGTLAAILTVLLLGGLDLDLELIALVGGGALVMFLGLADDIKGLSVRRRFLFQILICAVVVVIGLRLDLPIVRLFIDAPGVDLVLNSLLSVFILVGFINAFNIIDILDGFAGGVALFAGLAFSIMAGIAGHAPLVVFAGLAVAGASLGFLRYNYHPAKMFMGDTGSTFLGFMLGAIGILYTRGHPNPVAVFTPLVVLAIPIFDTTYVMILRKMKGMSPLQGSKDHFALRMVEMGIGKKETVEYIYVLAACLSMAGIVMQMLTPGYFVLVFLMALISMVSFGHLLWKAVDVPLPDEREDSPAGRGE